jgi:hypothetical protein
MLKAQGLIIKLGPLTDEEFDDFIFSERQRLRAEANQTEIDYWWPLLVKEEEYI